MNITIIDDNESFREVIKFWTNQVVNSKIIGEFSGIEEFIGSGSGSETEILIVNLQIPVGLKNNYLDKIVKVFPLIKIIAVSMYFDQVFCTHLKKSKVSGCIEKSFLNHGLELAINNICNGGYYYPEKYS